MDLAVNVAGEGPPVLLLHGFTGSGASWARQMTAWAPFCTILAVDLPGHGRSPAPADPAGYTMESTVAALIELLDRLGVARAGVVGYSMGGRVALALALAHPARVGALVLESASPGLAQAAERAARVAADAELAEFIEREGIPAFVDRWERLPLWTTQAALPDEVRANVQAQRLQNNPLGLANSLRGLGTGSQPPLWDQLPDLACPTFLVAGREDAKFAALAEQMAGLIPRSEVLIVHGAGHTVHLEQPAIFNRLVRDFLLEQQESSDAEGV